MGLQARLPAPGRRCIAIKIPAHAYLVAAGDRWQCERGFYDKSELACAVLLLPKNAHLGDTGHDWECDRGFRKQRYGCAVVQAPSHAMPRTNSMDAGGGVNAGTRPPATRASPFEFPKTRFSERPATSGSVIVDLRKRVTHAY